MTGPVALEKIASARKELQRLYKELHFQRRAVIMGFDQPVSLIRPSPVDFPRLAQIEDLMLLLEADQRPAFTITPRRQVPNPPGRGTTLASAEPPRILPPAIHANPAGRMLLRLDDLAQFVVPRNAKLSIRVSLFLDVLSHVQGEIGSPPRHLNFAKVPEDFSVEEALWLNAFVVTLRQGISDNKYRKTLSEEWSAVKRRYEGAEAYLNEVCKKRDVLLIPLELATGYWERRSSSASGEQGKKPDLVQWFNDFLTRGRGRAAFSAVIGHIGRLEYSESLGYYARVVFLLDAEKVPDPQSAANAIGELWVNDYAEKKAIFSPFCLRHADAERLNPISQISEMGRKAFLDSVLLYMAKQEFVFIDENIKKLGQWFFRGRLKSKSNGVKGNSSGVDKVGEKTKVDSVVEEEKTNGDADIDDKSSGELNFPVMEGYGESASENKNIPPEDVISTEDGNRADVADDEPLHPKIVLKRKESTTLRFPPSTVGRSKTVNVDFRKTKTYVRRMPIESGGEAKDENTDETGEGLS